MEEYCCDEVKNAMERYGKWLGGSHYHCAHCNKLSSMMGHYHSLHYVDGKPVAVKPHFSCSDECDLTRR